MTFAQRPLVVVAASLVFPPLGLVLLWMRAATPVSRKAAGSLAIAAVGVAHLFLFYGMKVELAGSGSRPIFSFQDQDAHMQELEESRAAQKVDEPPAVPAAPAPQAATEAAPVAAAPAKLASTYWADFRGPGRRGHYEEKPILTSWPSSGLQRLWKQPVGGGYASFSIANGVAFTIEQRRTSEVVAAYDIRSGRELWTNSWPALFQESMGGDGPRATPVWDDGRVYALGAQGELRCLDAATGKAVWSKNILSDNGASNLQWGMANAPLIVDGKVIVTPGGSSGRSIVAYDKMTGSRVWGTLDDEAAYMSPVLAELAGQRQIVVATANRVVGITVEEGKLLWSYDWGNSQGISSAQPIVLPPNRVFVSAAYGTGAAMIEIGAQGGGFAARTLWTSNRMKNRFNSSVLYQGAIYGLDEGILASLDAATGNFNWKSGRYGYGQLLLASGHLVVLTEDGDLVLVKPAPDALHEVARFSAIEGKTWNHPAISEGILLVRNESEMAAFRIAD